MTRYEQKRSEKRRAYVYGSTMPDDESSPALPPLHGEPLHPVLIKEAKSL